MNFTKAFAVFMQIDSKEFTEDEKYEAIQQVLDGMKAQKGNTHDQNLKR